jgi:hypothetical protein
MTDTEYKEKCKVLADFYTEAFTSGRRLQYDIGRDLTIHWQSQTFGPDLASNMSKWRLEPEPPKEECVYVVWFTNGDTALFCKESEAVNVQLGHPDAAFLQKIVKPKEAK